MVPLYRKRPVTVEALEFSPDTLVEVIDFLRAGKVHFIVKSAGILIRTPTGDMLAEHGDYLIRGLQGEYYPVKPDAFVANYESLGAIDDLQ